MPINASARHPTGSASRLCSSMRASSHLGEYRACQGNSTRAHFLEIRRALFGRRIDGQRLFSFCKRLVVGIPVLIDFMGNGAAHAELDAVVLRVRHGDGFARHRDQRSVGLVADSRRALLGRSEVGDEHVLPLHDGSGLDVLDVKNLVGELLGEHALLDLGGELSGAQPGGGGAEVRDRRRRQPDGRHSGGGRGQDRE